MAAHTLESLGRQVIEGNSHRKHFDRTPLEYANQIVEEAQELVKEVTEAFVTDNPVAIIGEIGDLYVLLAQICEEFGFNPADAMHFKVMRNQYKYPDQIMNNGYSRPDSFSISKRFYSEIIGGDAAFSHAYLDYLAEEST